MLPPRNTPSILSIAFVVPILCQAECTRCFNAIFWIACSPLAFQKPPWLVFGQNSDNSPRASTRHDHISILDAPHMKRLSTSQTRLWLHSGGQLSRRCMGNDHENTKGITRRRMPAQLGTARDSRMPPALSVQAVFSLKVLAFFAFLQVHGANGTKISGLARKLQELNRIFNSGL